MRTLLNFLFWEKRTIVLSEIAKGNGKSLLELKRKANTCYNTVRKVVKELELLGIVKTIKRGKNKQVLLTKKGKTIGKKFLELFSQL